MTGWSPPTRPYCPRRASRVQPRPGCQPECTASLAAAGGAAVRLDFAASLVRTLWFQVGVFGLSGLLMLAWPSGVGRRRVAPGGDAELPARSGTPFASEVFAAQPAVIGGSREQGDYRCLSRSARPAPARADGQRRGLRLQALAVSIALLCELLLGWP